MKQAAIVAFLCLSVAYLVNCQTCPEDVQDNPQSYYRSAYAPGTPIVSKRCTYTIRSGYLGVYFGPPRLVRKTYYVCADGLSRLDLGGFIICDEDATLEEIDPTDDEASETTATQEPTQPTEATDPTEGPTFAGGLKACPTNLNAYQKNDYKYSSLALIEQVRCVIRATVNGAPANRIGSAWMCKEGYKRQSARRGQFNCVPV